MRLTKLSCASTVSVKVKILLPVSFNAFLNVQDMTDKKAVLVSFKDRNRVVHFTGSDLVPAVREVFCDLLNDAADIVLQLKDDSWGGVYIDLQDRIDLVQDRSVLRIIVDQIQEVTKCLKNTVEVEEKPSFFRVGMVEKSHRSLALWRVRTWNAVIHCQPNHP